MAHWPHVQVVVLLVFAALLVLGSASSQFTNDILDLGIQKWDSILNNIVVLNESQSESQEK